MLDFRASTSEFSFHFSPSVVSNSLWTTDCSTPGFPVNHHSRSLFKLTSIKLWWCYPAISSSVIPFSSCLQSFPASGSFPVSPLFAFPGGSDSKESACDVGDLGSIPGLGRSPEEGNVVNEARFLGWGRGSWELWVVCILALFQIQPFPLVCEPYRIKRLTGSFSHTQVSTSTSHQHMVKNLPAVQETPGFDPWVRTIPWRKEW